MDVSSFIKIPAFSTLHQAKTWGGWGKGECANGPLSVLLALNINEMCRCDLVPEREKEKQTDCKGDWGKRRKKRGRGNGASGVFPREEENGEEEGGKCILVAAKGGGGYASGRGLHFRMSYV